MAFDYICSLDQHQNSICLCLYYSSLNQNEKCNSGWYERYKICKTCLLNSFICLLQRRNLFLGLILSHSIMCLTSLNIISTSLDAGIDLSDHCPFVQLLGCYPGVDHNEISSQPPLLQEEQSR